MLTIAVEDYFQYTAMGNLIPETRWNRFESRIENNTLRTLDLLDSHKTKATFFVLGWIADKMPEILLEISQRGHELASKGYYHKPIQRMLVEEFREDARRSRHAIEDASNRGVSGYRVAQGHFALQDLWALDVLSEEGYSYDSSMYPRFRSIASEPWRRFPHVVHSKSGDIWEMPLSTWGTNTFLLPAAGGNYFRQAPRVLVRKVFHQWATTYQSPFNMYFHIWELDPDLPDISAVSWLTRIRMYRNIDKALDLYKELLTTYNFISIADHLQIRQYKLKKQNGNALKEGNGPPVQSAYTTEIIKIESRDNPRQDTRPRITIVIPCYNEELALPYLANTLKEVKSRFSKQWRLCFLLVDDGSSDSTWDSIEKLFGNQPDYKAVRHLSNRGVAAAVLTGINEAETDIVCSIDCDCTYDPLQLESMLPLLKKDVSLVTASPYHPLGQVVNVPAWRLFLSKTLSRIYGTVLRHKLATYTSCFRVYRRQAVVGLKLRHENFLGIAELLALLDLRGEKIVECPAVLEVRIFGVSKMKTLCTIFGHIGLVARILCTRIRTGNKNSGIHSLR